MQVAVLLAAHYSTPAGGLCDLYRCRQRSDRDHHPQHVVKMGGDQLSVDAMPEQRLDVLIGHTWFEPEECQMLDVSDSGHQLDTQHEG